MRPHSKYIDIFRQQSDFGLQNNLGTSQTMTPKAGQRWTGSLSPTFQILINKVLRTFETMTYFRKTIPL